MNENHRQGMRLICCFKIYDLVAAWKTYDFSIEYHSQSFFSNSTLQG